MKTSNRIIIDAPFERLFHVAADIAHWPYFLPHYRWVKILKAGPEVVAEMAARHRGIPLWWKTIQRPRPEVRRIDFTHIGGITKGMEVYWSFTPADSAANQRPWTVEIHHDFRPAWPIIGDWVADRIIGRLFVHEVAQKTLRRIKQIVESVEPDGPLRIVGENRQTGGTSSVATHEAS